MRDGVAEPCTATQPYCDYRFDNTWGASGSYPGGKSRLPSAIC